MELKVVLCLLFFAQTAKCQPKEEDMKMFKPKPECDAKIKSVLECRGKVADLKFEIEQMLETVHDECFVKNGCERISRIRWSPQNIHEKNMCGEMVREHMARKLVLKCARLPMEFGIGRRGLKKMLEKPPNPGQGARRKRQIAMNDTMMPQYLFWPCKDEKSAKAAWECAEMVNENLKKENKKAMLREQAKEAMKCFENLDDECMMDLEMRQKLACHCVKRMSCNPIIEAAMSMCAEDNADPYDLQMEMQHHLGFLERDICCKGGHCVGGPNCLDPWNEMRGFAQGGRFLDLEDLARELRWYFTGEEHPPSKPGPPPPGPKPDPKPVTARPLSPKEALERVKEQANQIKKDLTNK